jgi:hypothetical protein
MSVCCEQVNESDSDEGSPRRVYVPVRSSAPTPVASAKKVKVNPAHVAEARAREFEQCKTPEEFVKQIVYEGLSAEHVQFATQVASFGAVRATKMSTCMLECRTCTFDV